MIGVHTVKVTSQRQDQTGAPINYNPFFTTDANGWTRTAGTGWAAGSVHCQAMEQALGFRNNGPLNNRYQYRIRVIVTATGARTLNIELRAQTTTGQPVTRFTVDIPANITTTIDRTFTPNFVAADT